MVPAQLAKKLGLRQATKPVMIASGQAVAKQPGVIKLPLKVNKQLKRGLLKGKGLPSKAFLITNARRGAISSNAPIKAISLKK